MNAFKGPAARLRGAHAARPSLRDRASSQAAACRAAGCHKRQLCWQQTEARELTEIARLGDSMALLRGLDQPCASSQGAATGPQSGQAPPLALPWARGFPRWGAPPCRDRLCPPRPGHRRPAEAPRPSTLREPAPQAQGWARWARRDARLLAHRALLAAEPGAPARQGALQHPQIRCPQFPTGR